MVDLKRVVRNQKLLEHRKMNKRVYIKTVGCQMNVLDSEMVIADLKRHGYTVVDTPKEADAFSTTPAVCESMLRKKYTVRWAR